MKASHFDIAKMGGNLTKPRPFDYTQAVFKPKEKFDINEARQRLGDAHWTLG